MPAELAVPLASAREPCVDEQLKADCADAVFLLVSHVRVDGTGMGAE